MKRILVIDDDRATQYLIRGLLEPEGFRVVTASNGAEGLERISRDPFDLVLLDVWMPEMTGLEFLAKLRQLPSHPKIVVMTADDAPETLLQAVRDQAYRYIRKPLEPRGLREIIETTLHAEPNPLPIEVLSAIPNWVELVVPCQLEAADRLQEFMAHLDADLPEDVRFSIGHAFRELLRNAVEWGGKLEPDRKVRIACLRTRRMVLYRIADPGLGFKFEELEHAAASHPDDPISHVEVRAEKGLRAGGYGILMTRALVDELLYNEAQNEVVFVKYLD
jgi:CheY-like chemotaxis protein